MKKHSLATKLFLLCLIPLAASLLASCKPVESLFSFVVIADPHITGDPDHAARLSACVDWVNTNKDADKIDLVFIVGDIGWGSGQPAVAKGILDGLSVPYLPLIGDNEVHGGSEQEVDATFAPHYDELAGVLPNWKKAPNPVWNPEVGDLSYFQNFSFDHKGIHFMGLDWGRRKEDPILGEGAILHDTPGGTWPWFTQDIADAPKDTQENIVMFSHHPMYPLALGAFTAEDANILETFTAGYGSYVSADYAGHLHINTSQRRALGQYDVFITAATWSLQTSVRLVGVNTDGTKFTYTQQSIIVQ